MSTLYKWRIYCTTNSRFEVIWDTESPTVCPVNGGHGVNVGSVHFIETVKTFRTMASNAATDGNNVYRLQTVSGNVQLTLPSIGDNPDRVIIIQRLTTNGNTATIVPNISTELINGVASYSLTTDKQTIKIKPNGNNWELLDIAGRIGEKDGQLEANIFTGGTQETSFNYTDINATPAIITRYVASTIGGTPGSFTWTSQVGIGTLATQSSATSSVVAASLGGQTSLNMSVANWMSLQLGTNLVLNTGFTFAMVFQDFTPAALANQRLIAFNQAPGNATLQFKIEEDNTNNNFKFTALGGSTLNLSTFKLSTTVGTPQIFTMRYDGTKLRIILNGTTLNDDAYTVPALTSTHMHFGASDLNNGVGATAIKIAEIIVWSGALSDAEFSDLSTNLRVNYNVATAPAPTVLALGELTDVTLGTVTANQLLQYDASNSRWVNQDLIAGDGLDKTTNTLSVDLKTNGGLVIETAKLAIDLGATSITGTLSVADGGTNLSSYAVGDIIYASGTTALSKLADIATGNALITGGVGVAPSYGKIGLTTHVTGTLAVGSGGTNLTSYAVGDLLYASGTTTLASLADIATGNALITGGVGVAPSYGKIGLTTHVSGTLAVGSGGTGATTLTANGILLGNGTSAITALKSEFAQTVPPNNNDDAGDGYAVGSFWFDITADKAYVCLDATATFAVWPEITGGGGGSVTAGDGIDVALGVVSVDLKANGGLVIESTELAIDLGATSITGVLAATDGGSGQSSYAVGDILYASTTTALSKLADIATGNALITGGVGVAPSYGKIGLTTHVSGTLAVASGGTNLTSYAVGDLLYASGTTALSSLADIATGNALITGGIGVAPSYGKIGLTTHVSGTLAVGSGGTNLTSYAVGDLLYASGTTTLASLADIATGNALITGGVGVAPSYGKIGLTTHVSGTLAVGSGGTGATTLTANGILLGNGTSAITALKSEFAQTVPPNGGDDIGDGYAVGSFWFDTTADKAYVCLDATATAAVWTEITSLGTTPTAGDGIDITISTISVDLKANGGLVIESTELAIDLGATSITGVLAATDGGSGQSSYAVGDILYASTTTALSKLADIATGNALITGGVGVAPSYGKIGLTTHVSGTLAVGSGGTNLTSYAVGDLLYASGTTALSSLADIATGNALITGGVGVAPSYGKIGLTTHVSGTLAVGSGGTNLTSYAVGDLLYASGTTALSSLADIATGNALITGGVGVAPSYGKIGLTTHVSGTLAVGSGGTGATTLTANGILLGNGTSAITALKSEFAQTAQPTTGDDTGDGYAVGSFWFDTTNDKAYVCLDATATAAVWTEITSGSSYTAGDGIDITVSTISVDLKANGGLVIESTELAIDLGATSMTGTLSVADGGTNLTSYAVGDIIYASGTTALSKLADIATGNALITGGVGVAPSYGKIGLTTHVSGTLDVGNGGTNLTSYAVGDIIYASGTTALSKLADIATGNALITGGVGVAPSYGKIGLTTHVSGTLPVASGGTNIASYTTGDIIYASGSTALSTLADIATGNALITGGVGVAPSYGKIGLTTHVSGTLAVGSGGTGATTLTANGILLGNGTSAITAIKSEFAKTVAPATTDDGPDGGYAVGSLWLDTTADKGYIALDITDNAAVWKNITYNNLVSTYTTVFGTTGTTGDIAITNDLMGKFYYRDTWRSVIDHSRILSSTTYNYAYLTSASNINHSRSRYWYRWSARAFTAQQYTLNTLPATVTGSTNYQSTAATGSVAAYNSQTVDLDDDGGGGAVKYLYVNKSGNPEGSVLLQFGAAIGAQNFTGTSSDTYGGWTLFCVMKDIERLDSSGRVLVIDSQRGTINGGGAYTGTDYLNTNAIVLNFFAAEDQINIVMNGQEFPLFHRSETTSKAFVLCIQYIQNQRQLRVWAYTYDPTLDVSAPTLTNATTYYEDNATSDTLQYLRFGGNNIDATNCARLKLYEVIVFNYAIEYPQRTMLSLYNEYKNS